MFSIAFYIYDYSSRKMLSSFRIIVRIWADSTDPTLEMSSLTSSCLVCCLCCFNIILKVFVSDITDSVLSECNSNSCCLTKSITSPWTAVYLKVINSSSVNTFDTSCSGSFLSGSFSRYLRIIYELLLLTLVITISTIFIFISVLGVWRPLSKSSITSSSR